MHPILFEVGGITVYSYGFLIAIGAITGVAYMAIQGKKDVGLSFDQANTLFLLIFFAAFVGGKLFLFFENPSYYLSHPREMLAGRGFVFYGSFVFAVPTMLWFFKKNRIPARKMLDVMAITTCLVHMFGRLGCLMAGCCHGKPASFWGGITFSNPACYADPKGVPLHPTQLYEAIFIFLVMCFLLYIRSFRKFYGQLFLVYLLLYAFGRFFLEFLRGDAERGFVLGGYISHSQFVAIAIIVIASAFYFQWKRRYTIQLP